MIREYVKRPVVVKAVQWLGINTEEILKFVKEATITEGKLYIHTLEGDMRANLGDYIIKGVHGEFYPCAREIFEETYNEYSELS